MTHSLDNPYRAAGTFDGATYVEREADSQLLISIEQNARYPYVLAPRQSGKSSLMVHTAKRLDPRRFRWLFVDLSKFPSSAFESYVDFLIEFEQACYPKGARHQRIDRITSIEPIVTKILKSTDKHVVFFVDEVDVLIHVPFKNTFFSQIRACFNERAWDFELTPLQFVLAGAATPRQLISDPNISPFNVGIEVPLLDLTETQVKGMLGPFQMHGEQEIDIDNVAHRIFSHTRGSTYLTQLVLERLWGLLVTMARDLPRVEDVENIVSAIVEGAPADIHFTNIAGAFEDSETYRAWVLFNTGGTLSEEQHQRLRLTGLVTNDGDYRNSIYRRVFGSTGSLLKPSSVFDVHFIKELALGFFDAIHKLTLIESNSALQLKAAKVRNWLSLIDALQTIEQGLASALTRTKDELMQLASVDFAERLPSYLNNAVANTAISKMIAATTLEMLRDDPNIVPKYLIQQIGIPDFHRGYFRIFLCCLRRNLSEEHGCSEVFSYANELAGFDRLSGFASGIAASLDYVARISGYLAFEFRSRRLSDDRKQGLEDYLSHLRQNQLLYAPLPLVRAGTQDRSDARLKDIFVPIAVRQQEKASSHQSDAELGSLILSERRVALLGPPGGGKTTLLKHAALALAEGRCEDIPGWKASAGVIPIFLRLKSLATYLQALDPKFFGLNHSGIIDYLDHYYHETERVSLPPNFFEKLLDEGGCGVFMDGLDEVPLNQREDVAIHVDSFMRRYGEDRKVEAKSPPYEDRDRNWDNIFILTSRPKGYELVESLFRSSSFAVREVKPLEQAGIRQLVGNLLNYIELNEIQRLRDFDGLCDAIFRSTDLTILAGTPLFCTSLVLMYKYRGAELPQRRIDVFEEIVNLLLGFWKAQDLKDKQSGRLDEDDGAGTTYVDLGMVVNIKKRRLSYIAFQMQLSEKRTEINFPSLVDMLSTYLIGRERTQPEDVRAYAEQFLITSHERSGLLVETEPSDPAIYAFAHEGFREYLVADALANLRETEFISTILDNIDNPTWEEVIVLAGAHQRLSDGMREFLLEECVTAARVCKSNGNLDGWARRLTIAGRMARDMGEYLSQKDRVNLKEVLAEEMLHTGNHLKHRIDIALVLDDLGWLTDNLFACVPISVADQTQFYIGKNLVANQQYQRFLDAPDFGDLALWENPFCIDSNGLTYNLNEESIAWLRTNKDDSRMPKSWNDPKFGIAHRGLPIVGICWYEASAYCRWLKKHWNELDEAHANPDLHPQHIRLPTEHEWHLAVFGIQRAGEASVNNVFDFIRTNTGDLLAYANTGKSLDRTSPLGMFLNGKSYPNGLVDACGNAWEWQANCFDHSYRAISLCGGAFTTSMEDLCSDLRGWSAPAGRDDDLGFRILVEI